MALVEETKVDKMEILEDGQIQVREARIIRDDVTGEEVARKFHRYVLDPGRTEDRARTVQPNVEAVREAVWTPEVVTSREQVLTRQRETGGRG